MFDLPESNMLIEKYLNKNNISNFSTRLISEQIEKEEFDLVISNYAISEIRRDIQIEYFNKIIMNSKRGYLTLNFIGHIFGVDTLNKAEILSILSEKFKIFELKEEPLTESNNIIVYWDNEKNTN